LRDKNKRGRAPLSTMAGELEFVMGWFRRYYTQCPPPPPPRFGRREFGFMFFDKGFMQRHLSFTRASDLQDFLVRQVPAHAYHSSAYYELPGAPTMEEKCWKGADLIFDLDADHIRGAEKLTYEQMLDLVKEEVIRLVDDFLLGDLGFDEADMKVLFSGGRGYHVHIFSEAVLGMKSHERREIVDYITATDLDMNWVFESRASYQRTYGDKKVVGRTRLIPDREAGGWRGRMKEALEGLLGEMKGMDPQQARDRYPSLRGVSDGLLESLLHELFKEHPRSASQLMLRKGNLEVFSDRRTQTLFLQLLEKEMKPRMAGQVDEPVTSDIKRLIRMPFSLHGKTGLAVTPVPISDLRDFRPLRDAVPSLFPSDPIMIETLVKVDLHLGGERINLEGTGEVPTFAALFLLCRKEARLA